MCGRLSDPPEDLRSVYPSSMHGPPRTPVSWCRAALLGALAVLVVAATVLPAPAAAAPWTGRTFPDRYDLRKLGRVSHVGKQNGYGTCWIFAATGSLESVLLPGTAP